MKKASLVWWRKWPGRLAFELAELDKAGVRHERDDTAFASNIIKLRLWCTVSGHERELSATYPDLFPYFRPEVRDPARILPLHHHPVSGNLCLLGRPTINWTSNWTLAHLLATQLQQVYDAAEERDAVVAAAHEQLQAEPFSDYYPHGPGCVLIQRSWSLPHGVKAGFLQLGLALDPLLGAKSPLQAAVLEIQNDARLTLLSVNPAIRNTYNGQTFLGRWLRVESPIAMFNPKEFFAEVIRRDSRAHEYAVQIVGRSRFRIWGILFPEEHARRDATGDGWTFILQVDQDVPLPRGIAAATMVPSKASEWSKGEMTWL